MLSKSLRWLIVLVFTTLSIGSAMGAELAIKDVVNPLGYTVVALSPDGKHCAMIGFTGKNHGLIMLDNETQQMKLLLVGKWVDEGAFRVNKEPRNVIWITNDLLAVDYGVEAESITIEGKKVAYLGTKVMRKVDPDRSDSPLLLVYTDVDFEKIGLVDATTGEITRYRIPMSGSPVNWTFDTHGKLRALTLMNSAFWKDVTVVSNWYRKSESAEWEKLAEFKVTDNYWTPMSVPDKENSLIISSSVGRDTRAVFDYNTRTHEIGEMLAGHPTQDILSVDGINQDEFKSVATNGMLPQRVWFDSTWNNLQASVDAALPKRINRLTGDPAKNILIFSYSDVDPGRWYLLRIKGMEIHLIAEVKPSIDVAKMRPMKMVNYPSVDGTSIPAYLTVPGATQGPVPTVVMVHGGPTVRDTWGWDADVQMLAGHGYAVFQPQFRGSSGFGRKFEEAGYGEWGLAMQDDVTAGVQYLIKQGIADPKRICIYGASYGGYAALWGLVKTPDLYRCGVSFAGVADIEYMFNDYSDRAGDKIGRQFMRSHIGDATLNKEQFDAVSPLKHADQIQAPLLLMHGADDERVPISHSRKMMQALDENHKVYEWHKFKDEGHGITYVVDQIVFYETLLKFLDKYIGPSGETIKGSEAATVSTSANTGKP